MLTLQGLTLVVLLGQAVGAQPSEPQSAVDSVGFVLEVRGAWVMDGVVGGKLRTGQALPAGASVRAVSPQAQWRLVVALANGTTLTRSCEPVEACREAIVLPVSMAEQPGFWARARAAAAALFGHPPERYAATLSRGMAAADGVVLLEAGRLQLEEIVGDLPAGRYAVSLRPVEPEGAAVIRELPLTLSGAGPEAIVKVESLQMGLYEVRVRTAANPDESASAWMLAVDGAHYQQDRDAYEAARRTTATWNEAQPRAVRSFLRAYLTVLAGEFSR